MAGAIRSLIVGGGVRAGTPSSLNTFPIFSGATPPDILIDGNIRQDTSTPPRVFIGEASIFTGSTVIGGATVTGAAIDHIVIGNGATNAATSPVNSNVVIGKLAIGGTGAANVVIGDRASAAGSGATSASCVVIGRQAIIGASAGGANSVVIGDGASLSLGSQQVLIGSSAQISANNLNIAIGFTASITGGAGIASCIVIGPNSSTNKTNNIIIGSGTANTVGGNALILIGNGVTSSGAIANAVIIGGVTHRITQFIIGAGNADATVDAVTLRLTDAAGANLAAGSLTIRPGNSTGAGAQQSIIFQTQSAAGAASVLGTMTTQVSIVPSTGAAGQANLRFDNVTSGAGAAAGTLANAPTAGNPVFWLPVNIAGNIRYIPCWP